MGRRNLRTLHRKKERKRTRFVLALGLICVLSAIGMFFLVKHAMIVRELSFSGNMHLKNEELKALTRLKKGDELFSSSGEEIRRRLKASPWVKEAIVRKDLSGRVQVRMTEAVPLALLDLRATPALTQGGGTYLIDGEGNILEQLKEGTAVFLPVIKDIHPGEHRDAYVEALSLVKVLQGRRLPLEEGVEITGQRPEELTLRLGTITIKMGSGDFEKKLEKLLFVRDEVKNRNIAVEYIDLRFANRIIVKSPQDVEDTAKKEAVKKELTQKESGKKAVKKKKATKKAGKKSGEKRR